MLRVTDHLTKRYGKPGGWQLDVYARDGGYEMAKKALGMERSALVDEMKAANIRGRGGAGFPMGVKWSFMPWPPKPEKPHYLVINADEGEPGTFKDRTIMELDPHAVVEGCIIGCYGIGAHTAYIYVRDELHLSKERLWGAIHEAKAKGYLGKNPFGSDYAVEVVVHTGAGAYICGEETALLNSLEGKRGEPRLKPPFPAIKGLYGEPTVVNNVETLAYLPYIMRNGPEWFAKAGPERSPGFKVVSISGHVRKPGNYEVAMGTTIRQLIDDCAGGLRLGREFRGVQPGGGSSACLFEEHLDLPYDFDSIAKAGSMLGSGAMVVFDDTTDWVKAAHSLIRFYAHESCGQCTPCREGGDWIERTLKRILDGRGVDSDIDVIVSAAHQLTGLNLCALGDSIEPFLASVIKRYEADFRAYITRGTGLPSQKVAV
jgi:NADH-quinone oxidoreductase subunit F